MRLDGAFVAVRGSALSIVILIVVSSTIEVGRAFVLVWTTMLQRTYLLALSFLPR